MANKQPFRLSVQITKMDRERLNRLAEAEGGNPSEVVRQLIREAARQLPPQPAAQSQA